MPAELVVGKQCWVKEAPVMRGSGSGSRKNSYRVKAGAVMRGNTREGMKGKKVMKGTVIGGDEVVLAAEEQYLMKKGTVI